MGTLLLILQLIGALPTIIKVIREIISLINDIEDPDEKKAKQDELWSIVKAAKNRGAMSSDGVSALENLLKELREAS